MGCSDYLTLLRILSASLKPTRHCLDQGVPEGQRAGVRVRRATILHLVAAYLNFRLKLPFWNSNNEISCWTEQTNSNSIRRNANLQPSANFSENICTVDLVGDRSSCCSDQILISLKTFDLWCPDHVNCLETSQCPASDPPHHIAFLTVFLWEVQHILQIPSIHSKSTSFSLCAVHVPAGWWISGYYLNYFAEEQHRRGNYVTNSFWA